jgi:hypothetical protein
MFNKIRLSSTISFLWRHRPSRPNIAEVESSHTHTHTHKQTNPVGLLWTSDQLVEEAAAYTTNTRDELPTLSGIRTRDPSNQAAADRTAIGIGYIKLLDCICHMWHRILNVQGKVLALMHSRHWCCTVTTFITTYHMLITTAYFHPDIEN